MTNTIASDAVANTEARLQLRLPPLYLQALVSPRESHRWRYRSLDELGEIEDDVATRSRGVIIADDDAGNSLCLLVEYRDRLGEAVFYREHETRTMRQIAASLDELLHRAPKRLPEKNPPSQASMRVYTSRHELQEAASGDARAYLLLVQTDGAVADEYAAAKLKIDVERVQAILAELAP